VGGGSKRIKPGAVSVAHLGVLFLDEAPEFSVRVLESLRQPLESGEVVISRVDSTVALPSRFQLALAGNPCRCGYHGSRVRDCTCTPDSARRYWQQISGPVKDRIDLNIKVDPPGPATLDGGLENAERSKVIADRVLAARERQRTRFAGTGWRVNGEVPGFAIHRHFLPPAASLAVVHSLLRKAVLTARGADSVLRVAWTIADLAGHDVPTVEDVNEAIAHRLGMQI
jgi:magnesium chelatase family protein